MIELKCSKCKLTKSSNEFSKRNDTKRGFKSHCKKCIKLDELKNIEKSKQRSKRYYENNKQKILNNVQTYYFTNKKRVREYRRTYWDKRKQTDSLVRIIFNLRGRLGSFLKSKKLRKTHKLIEYLGCSKDELMRYLELKFTENMSWNNYGTWHIDHIMPLSSAKTEEDIYILCHYTNLQPLWAKDNLKKGSKVPKTVV